MANIIYKTDEQGKRLFLWNTTGYFTETGWLRIELTADMVFRRGDYICFGGEDLSEQDGIYEIVEAHSGIYNVKRINKERFQE